MRISKGKVLLLLLIITASIKTVAQNPENWTSKQLMQPAELASILSSGKQLPVILSVGPGAMLPHSINIGMVKDKENLDKLKKELNTIPKQTKIVVYCGCCPFDHCPNIRPAIQALKDMKFTNYMLLNLEHNIRTDWINKGYPTSE
jgi:thiosulfate/3-mercaptopyruvate sulfurtransferase